MENKQIATSFEPTAKSQKPFTETRPTGKTICFFSYNLKFLRKKHGYMASDLAAKLNTQYKNYRNWECGHCEPAIPVLLRICAFFNVSAQTMLTESLEDLAI